MSSAPLLLSLTQALLFFPLSTHCSGTIAGCGFKGLWSVSLMGRNKKNATSLCVEFTGLTVICQKKCEPQKVEWSQSLELESLVNLQLSKSRFEKYSTAEVMKSRCVPARWYSSTIKAVKLNLNADQRTEKVLHKRDSAVFSRLWSRQPKKRKKRQRVWGREGRGQIRPVFLLGFHFAFDFLHSHLEETQT